MAVRFISIDLQDEYADLTNDSDEPIDLEGYHIEDVHGTNKSHPFSSYVIQPGAIVRFWTTPKSHGGLTEDDENLFWRNKNGNPRTKHVLNNEGDGLRLISPEGVVTSSIYVEAGSYANSVLESTLSSESQLGMDVISDTQQEEEHYDEDEQTNLQTHDLDVEQDEKQQPLSPVSNSNDQQESQERPSVLMSNELSTPEDIRSSSRGSSINHSDWSANKPRSVTSPSFHKRVSVPGVFDPMEDVYARFCRDMDEIETNALKKFKTAFA